MQFLKPIVIVFVTIKSRYHSFLDMNNTKFATVVHILTILANNPSEYLSSEWIAKSININPVIVRRELSMLRQQGWVMSRKGKEGGSKLNKSSDKISLADIYIRVKNSEVLGKKNLRTNPQCPIGKDINNKLDDLFIETDALVIASLKQKTLEGFVEQFQ